MSTEIRRSPSVTSSRRDASTCQVPTLGELYQMTSEPEHRVVFRDVDWAFYEQLVDSIPDGCHIHVDYDGRDLEVTSAISPDRLAALAGAIAGRSMKVADYPNPDLAIEVDITPSTIDRPGIYAALRVSEVWRFDGDREQVIIERLDEDGFYHAVEGSSFLPIRAEEVRRWVVEEDSSDESAWARRFRAWVRAELASRRQC